MSNESKGNVYFDDIRIEHQQGPLLEENHFYPYGLKMAALSSKAFGSLLNKFQYQGSYSEWDEETGYDEFALRDYDPQLGRWTGVDPYDEFPSPYTGMGNDPVNNVDPDGGGIGDILPSLSNLGSNFLNAAGNTLIATGVGAGIGYFIDGKKGAEWGAGIGFAVGAGSYVPWDDVGAALGDAGRWIGNQFSSNYWILYDGLNVITYKGSYGDEKSKKVKQYAGTSGGEGYQNSGNQNIPDYGPVPDGDYSIDLRPDFKRKAKTNKDGSTQADVGVDLLPWGNGSLYSGWGQWRARLQKVKVNNSRDNFYFHDSYKGYSHGCIETNTSLYYDLRNYKQGGQKSIKVKVKYPTSNSPTNGGTKQYPPPWWNGKPIQIYNGVPFPEPAPGFPQG